MLNYAELIKQSVPMSDVVELLIPNCRIRHHRTKCPFHNGADDNFRIYRSSYYCFVCHAAGDVIRFVEDMNDIPFIDACQFLDATFHLGLFDAGDADRKRMYRDQQKRQTERILREYDVSLRERRLETLKDIERATDLIEQESRPTVPWEDYRPDWCAAVRLREVAREEIELADGRKPT